jgi:hypothetical protein
MYDCDSILQRLSQYLDGDLPLSELSALRQQAQARPGCAPLFEAMLWVDETLDAAPMVTPSRDFSVSVTRELAWRQRRDRLLLGGVILAAVLMALTPILLLAWAGLAAFLEPGIIQNAIGWVLGLVGDVVAYGVALAALLNHAPRWALIPISTFLSLSLLLLALVIVMQKSPDLLFGPVEAPHQQHA